MNELAQDELLLSLAGQMANRIVEVVNSESLENGTIQETIVVGEHEFVVSVHHHRDSGIVVITGQPVLEIDPSNLPDMLSKLMNGGDEGQAGGFNFGVPVAWLPKLEVG